MKRFLLLAMPLLVMAGSAIAQTSNIIEPEPITSAFQKANVGRIVFIGDTVSIDKLTDHDVLTSYEMRPKNLLYMKVLMDNSLTNYQHRLAPSLTIDQLNEANFQFTFYVDGKQIYQENMQRRSGLNSIKNVKTVISVPLSTNRGEDSWGRSLFFRFLMRGGEDALNTGTHKLRIEARPYVSIPEIKVGNLIASGELTVIVPAVSIAEQKLQPIKPNSGWPVSTDKIDVKKIEELNKLIAQNKFKDITSIVVIKDGKLLLEEYFNGSARDSLHDPRSVGKTFTSAVMGIAIHEGHIKNEDVTLDHFFDLKKFGNYSTLKDKISLKSLLTMSSIFDADDNDGSSPGNEDNMYDKPDWVKFALDLKVDSSKTALKQWHYFTAGMIVLGDILNRSVPGGLEKYADQKLFWPLGIKHYQWQYTPQHVPNTAGGLQMRSLDYARFGQVYKNGGKWDGKQIIPTEWVQKTFTKYLSLPADVVGPGYYGYLFWNKTYTVNDKPYETFYCTGNGGNKIFVFTNQPLVIIITATAYNTPYAHPQVDKMMQEYILPAVGN